MMQPTTSRTVTMLNGLRRFCQKPLRDPPRALINFRPRRTAVTAKAISAAATEKYPTQIAAGKPRSTPRPHPSHMKPKVVVMIAAMPRPNAAPAIAA